jgi:hypothetical protein
MITAYIYYWLDDVLRLTRNLWPCRKTNTVFFTNNTVLDWCAALSYNKHDRMIQVMIVAMGLYEHRNEKSRSAKGCKPQTSELLTASQWLKLHRISLLQVSQSSDLELRDNGHDGQLVEEICWQFLVTFIWWPEQIHMTVTSPAIVLIYQSTDFMGGGMKTGITGMKGLQACQCFRRVFFTHNTC